MSILKQLRRRRLDKDYLLFEEEVDNIQRIMEDETYQNTFLPSELLARVTATNGVDKWDDGSGEFGFDANNPIPVNGPLGAITYLSCLKTESGERLLFQRVGGSNDVEAYEAVTYSGDEWFVFFLDIYHPRKSHLLPEGFELSGGVAMFSGFVDTSSCFPGDYTQRVEELDASLQAAYAPETRLNKGLDRRIYTRPIVHWAKLEALSIRGFV